MNLGNCDVCGRELQGYTSVNGMKFCAKCYQETFGQPTNNCLYCAFKSGDEKMKTNSIKGFEKLKKENQRLKNQIEQADQQIQFMLDEIKNRETCGLCEKLDIKRIKSLEQENEVLKKALELACEKLKIIVDNFASVFDISSDYCCSHYFIEQAKESIDEKR